MAGQKLTKRKLEALKTREKLIKAARELIQEQGLDRTSISEITKRCGVANGTFYTYFKRKEDVLSAISIEIFNELYAKALSYEGSFLQRLEFFLINFSAYIEESGVRLCQEWVRNTVNPKLALNDDDKVKLDFDLNHLRSLIASGVEQGALRVEVEVDALSRLLVELLYGQMLCWDFSDGTYSYKERTKEFCEKFLPLIIKPYLKE